MSYEESEVEGSGWLTGELTPKELGEGGCEKQEDPAFVLAWPISFSPSWPMGGSLS